MFSKDAATPHIEIPCASCLNCVPFTLDNYLLIFQDFVRNLTRYKRDGQKVKLSTGKMMSMEMRTIPNLKHITRRG